MKLTVSVTVFIIFFKDNRKFLEKYFTPTTKCQYVCEIFILNRRVHSCNTPGYFAPLRTY